MLALQRNLAREERWMLQEERKVWSSHQWCVFSY